MAVLAGLDIATTTGLAVLRDNEVLATTWRGAARTKFLDTTNKFGPIDPIVEGDIGRRFEDFLRVWLVTSEVTHVAIEAPIISNNSRMVEEVDVSAEWAGQSVRKVERGATNISSVYRSMGLSLIALALCSRLQIPTYLVAQSTWRKEFVGNGRPKDAKQESKRQCEKLGIQVSSLDAAEAVGIVVWLERHLTPSTARRRADDLFASPARP